MAYELRGLGTEPAPSLPSSPCGSRGGLVSANEMTGGQRHICGDGTWWKVAPDGSSSELQTPKPGASTTEIALGVGVVALGLWLAFRR